VTCDSSRTGGGSCGAVSASRSWWQFLGATLRRWPWCQPLLSLLRCHKPAAEGDQASVGGCGYSRVFNCRRLVTPVASGTTRFIPTLMLLTTRVSLTGQPCRYGVGGY